MRAKLLWAGISVLSWIVLGIVLSLVSGSIVRFSQMDGLIGYRAAIGAAIGLFCNWIILQLDCSTVVRHS